jgi:hypothetical protein
MTRCARRALAFPAAVALAAGCGGGASQPAAPPPEPPTAALAQRALAVRLAAKDLSFRWVRCVDDGVRRGDAPVFRCNVNFGEPHIEGYCVVVRGGRAVTQVEERALRCRRTRAGDEP